MENALPKIIQIVKDQFRLDLHGDHGIFHWEQVEHIGRYLGKHYPGADFKIISLFAYLHDSRVENEFRDPHHGTRSAVFLRELYSKGALKVSQLQYQKLEFACRHHSDSTKISNDITVQICWDGDRLDLWRVGEIPNAQYLNTQIAKQRETIGWALRFIYDYYQDDDEKRPHMPQTIKKFHNGPDRFETGDGLDYGQFKIPSI